MKNMKIVNKETGTYLIADVEEITRDHYVVGPNKVFYARKDYYLATPVLLSKEDELLYPSLKEKMEREN